MRKVERPGPYKLQTNPIDPELANYKSEGLRDTLLSTNELTNKLASKLLSARRHLQSCLIVQLKALPAAECIRDSPKWVSLGGE